MPIPVVCPNCGVGVNAPDDSVGKIVDCPTCLASMVIPNTAFLPPPQLMNSVQRAFETANHGPARHGFDETSTDAPGVVGLVLGVIAAICLLLAFFTCGMTYFLAAPLAAVGVFCSACGRGNIRVAGLALNILTLIPAVILLGTMLIGAGTAAIAPNLNERPAAVHVQRNEPQPPVVQPPKVPDGALVLTTKSPIARGVEAWVEIDGRRAAEWKVGSKEVRITLTPGSYQVAVYSIYQRKRRTIFDNQVTISADATETVNVGP